MNAPTDPFGLVGSLIEGKYRVDRPIGEGGFGVVYAGFHTIVGQPVAIKVLKATSGADVETILREARVLFSLSHPNVVRFYDTGVVHAGAQRAQQLPYVVLEFVQGNTLEEELLGRIRVGGPHHTIDEIQAIVLPVLEGLAAAHAAGVVHRDVKPANIKLKRQDGLCTPKLLDFGLARAGAPSLQQSQLGVSLTPRYAAPEQWEPKLGSTGPWTDVFAVGAVLYEVCTLATAIPGEGLAEVIRASSTLRERIDLAQRRPDLPGALGPVLARAVARDPRERFQDARAMLQAAKDAFASASRPSLSLGATPPVYSNATPPPATGYASGQPQLASYAQGSGPYGVATGPYGRVRKGAQYNPWMIGFIVAAVAFFGLLGSCVTCAAMAE